MVLRIGNRILPVIFWHAILSSRLPGQQTFEAADVRVNRSHAVDASIDLLPGGRLSVRSTTLRQLILFANYNLSKDLLASLGNELASGGPAWLDSDRFDIVAKADATTSVEGIKSMLQALLAERFHLACHREDRPMRTYALVLSRNGPKLQPASAGLAPGCGPGEGAVGQIHRVYRNMTMTSLAAALPAMAPYFIDLPVVDLTGLNGAYNFHLDWVPVRVVAGGSASEGASTIGDAAGAKSSMQ